MPPQTLLPMGSHPKTRSCSGQAKLEELQALEQLLSDAALTSEKFTRWKDEHQELYQELREWWAGQGGQDGGGDLGAEQGPPKEAAEP